MNEYKVSVGFFKWNNACFSKTKRSLRETWLLHVLGLSKYVHCDIRIYNESIDLTLYAIENKQVSFYPTDSVHTIFGKPDVVIELGKFTFDLAKIDRFLFPSYHGSRWDLAKWFFLFRFLFIKRPKTCTTAVCHILRDLKVPVGKFVMPSTLLKEIKHAPHYARRKSWCWQNYFG